MHATGMLAVGLSLLGIAAAPPKRDTFMPGSIFTAGGNTWLDCDEYGTSGQWIREIDPKSGLVSFFATFAREFCHPNGLAFTPDGRRLRLITRGFEYPYASYIVDFLPSGSHEPAYGEEDGILCARDALTFSAQGDFYVSDECAGGILRFPVDGSGAELVHDESARSMAFAPNADLFIAVRTTGELIRLHADGSTTLFHDYGIDGRKAVTVAFDPEGSLFVVQREVIEGHRWLTLYRYDGTGAGSRRALLASEVDDETYYLGLAFGEASDTVFVVDALTVYAIDARTGEVQATYPVHDWLPTGFGLAVHVQPPVDPSCSVLEHLRVRPRSGRVVARIRADLAFGEVTAVCTGDDGHAVRTRPLGADGGARLVFQPLAPGAYTFTVIRIEDAAGRVICRGWLGAQNVVVPK